MTILYHNRKPKQSSETELGAQYVSKEELLARSVYVILTVPLTPETKGLIARKEIEQMKRIASLINIARGPVIDTEAMLQRRLHAAALDVTDPEPLPSDHPLLKLDNVIMTPHLGIATQETRKPVAELSVENLLEGLAGRPLQKRVSA